MTFRRLIGIERSPFTDVSFFFLVGHLLPIRSATDKDGEDEELLYTLDKSSKIPFELVSFGSNQIGKHP